MKPFAEGLFTDLYELTMAQAYLAEGMQGEAVFEMFFRQLPKHRGYVMAAGLDDVLAYLENLHFSAADLQWLRGQGNYSEEFLAHLTNIRFEGDVYAVPEGTIVFPHEPVVQVVAPMIVAQLIETLLINQVHFQSVAATKAARVVTAAAGRTVVDFGSRRAHGIDAALKVARTSYLAGAAGTSNVLAGRRYNLPVFGTMAHSYIQAHDDELQAFERFATLYPHTTLLVDTYDTLDGVRKVIALKQRMGDRFQVRALRLDSGDLVQLANQSRRLLNEAGLTDVQLFASGGLDEYSVAELIARGAPIDGFGVGTRLAVSRDAPDLDMAYKLVEYAERPRMKLSSDKQSYPGRKQVFRRYEGGRMVGDTIARFDEQPPGEPLLEPVMTTGQRTAAGRRTLADGRQWAAAQLAALPEHLHELIRPEPPFPVQFSQALQEDQRNLAERLEETQ